jgi:hypothetical protein
VITKADKVNDEDRSKWTKLELPTVAVAIYSSGIEKTEAYEQDGHPVLCCPSRRVMNMPDG